MAANCFTYVVIGGGIAGVTCAETLGHLTSGDDAQSILLISSSCIIKAVTDVHQYGYTLESMNVKERTSSYLTAQYPNLRVKHGSVKKLNSLLKVVEFADGTSVKYEKLCIATGGTPKKLADNPNVLAIRDTDSVKQVQQKLAQAERIVVVGNGGIATELVYEVKHCQVIWAIKHKSISATFFDAATAQFFLPYLKLVPSTDQVVCKRWKYHLASDTQQDGGERGSALGPDWASHFSLHGATQMNNECAVEVEYEVELSAVLTHDERAVLACPEQTASSKQWPVYVLLSNGRLYGADMIINATGVDPTPNIAVESAQFALASDGGILVDSAMRTNLEDVYAAGDVCSTMAWDHSRYWLQMKLWTQAKQMGCYAAKCMYGHSKSQSVPVDFCFEIFSHVTQFFGFKVVLLGLFNCQGLHPSEYNIQIRCTPGHEFIKAVLQNGHLVGAVLVGETNLEETFENLILNQLDLRHIEADLLNPDIDIDDYFD